MASVKAPELVCPAGSLPALKAAVDHGADAVYCGFRDSTNARNFAGLNFDRATMAEGIRYARTRGAKVLVPINTYAQAGALDEWHRSIDMAAALEVDALIVADVGLLEYACTHHPGLRLHLSVQGSATNHEAINFCAREFGVQRAVLPRVLTVAQVEQLIRCTEVEIEVFGFGSLCVMNEGRCWLSSYATGQSPNTHGACSPARFVRWENTAAGVDVRLDGILIDRFGVNEKAGYPTLCKGRFDVAGATYYALEEPTSLNVVPMLSELIRIGVAAIKVEGRQRSPAYVGQVTRALRAAIDAAAAGTANPPVARWQTELGRLAEGQQVTLGAYDRPWR